MSSVQHGVVVTDITDPDTGGLIAVDTTLGEGYAYPLTTCCNATGKGGGSGVICRSCYEDVDWEFGGGWYLSEIDPSVREQVIAAVAAAMKG